MTKHIIAGLIWFAAISLGYEILWSVADIPRLVGPVFAAVVGTFVAVDPAGRVWHRGASCHNERRANGLTREPGLTGY